MKQLLLFPFNGNAREAVSVVEQINSVSQEWELLGFIDDAPGCWGEQIGDYTVLGGRDYFNLYKDAYVLAVPGRPDNFRSRSQLIQSLQIPHSRLATIVHPSASVGLEATIGRNTLIMHNVVLSTGVSVGDHVVILPNTVISHESRVGDYSLLGSNVSVSGGVTVANNCYIGTGSKLIQEVHIGEQALVGIGAVVLADIPSRSVFVGNPARLLRREQ